MDGQIIAVYCLNADMRLAVGQRDDGQCHLTDAEVMTIAIVAALFFGGNYALTSCFLHEQGYMRRMLSPGRFNRIFSKSRGCAVLAQGAAHLPYPGIIAPPDDHLGRPYRHA